jgi:hypothetical protein
MHANYLVSHISYPPFKFLHKKVGSLKYNGIEVKMLTPIPNKLAPIKVAIL